MSGAAERVLVDVADGVAHVRLNRADKLNALDPAMFAGLVDAGERLARQPGVRAVVLSGEGRGFCSGLDFGSFQAMTGEGGDAGFAGIAATDGRRTHVAQQAAFAWSEVPVPVIAALHGVVFGGGLQIALGADLRVVAPDARLSVLEIRWGLIPDMTGTWTLPNLVGLDVAKELTFTGREVSGDEAVRLGLATRVADDPRAAALELARAIAGRSPDAIRAAKRLLNRAALSGAAGQFAAEREEIHRLIGSANQIEAVTAEFKRRTPAFTDA